MNLFLKIDTTLLCWSQRFSWWNEYHFNLNCFFLARLCYFLVIVPYLGPGWAFYLENKNPADLVFIVCCGCMLIFVLAYTYHIEKIVIRTGLNIFRSSWFFLRTISTFTNSVLFLPGDLTSFINNLFSSSIRFEGVIGLVAFVGTVSFFYFISCSTLPPHLKKQKKEVVVQGVG